MLILSFMLKIQHKKDSQVPGRILLQTYTAELRFGYWHDDQHKHICIDTYEMGT